MAAGKVDLLERMLRLFPEEQLVAILNDLESACEDSELKDGQATVEIIFKRGHPTHINTTQGRRLPDPKHVGLVKPRPN